MAATPGAGFEYHYRNAASGSDAKAVRVVAQPLWVRIQRAGNIISTFQSSDDEQRANVVVMSEPYWRTRFGADPGVVGSQLRLDGMLFTVVGVVPEHFRLVGRSDVWGLRFIRECTPARTRASTRSRSTERR